MLTRRYRLSKKGIDQVKNNGRRFYSPFFTVAYLFGQEANSQFAFVISKRVSKKATVRNRTKRLIAGSVRELLVSLRGGYWVVFLIRRSALDQSKEVLSGAVKEAFGRINLLRSDEELSS
jgi:ribonuclease P protein component